MDNVTKKTILSITGMSLSIIGVGISFLSGKVDDAIQGERIDQAVSSTFSNQIDNKIHEFSNSDSFKEAVNGSIKDFDFSSIMENYNGK